MISGFNHIDLGEVNFMLVNEDLSNPTYYATIEKLDSEIFNNKKPAIVSVCAIIPGVGTVECTMLCSRFTDGLNPAFSGVSTAINNNNKLTSEFVVAMGHVFLFMNVAALG